MEFIFKYLKELIEIGDILFVNGNYLKEYHAFEFLLSYSKNGIIWSIPIEISTPKNNLSKDSEPYIVSIENN